jgi:hypothetical protein
MVDASERLQVLLTQEATFYKTSDYLSTRMQSAPEQQSSKPTPMVSGSSSSSDAEATPPNKKRTFLLSTTTADMNYLVDDNSSESPKALNSGAASTTSSSEGGSLSLINKHWREKICSWAYQGKSRGSMWMMETRPPMPTFFVWFLTVHVYPSL